MRNNVERFDIYTNEVRTRNLIASLSMLAPRGPEITEKAEENDDSDEEKTWRGFFTAFPHDFAHSFFFDER